MIRRPPRSTPLYSSAASYVYKRQEPYSPPYSGHAPLMSHTQREHEKSLLAPLFKHSHSWLLIAQWARLPTPLSQQGNHPEKEHNRLNPYTSTKSVRSSLAFIATTKTESSSCHSSSLSRIALSLGSGKGASSHREQSEEKQKKNSVKLQQVLSICTERSLLP